MVFARSTRVGCNGCARVHQVARSGGARRGARGAVHRPRTFTSAPARTSEPIDRTICSHFAGDAGQVSGSATASHRAEDTARHRGRDYKIGD